MHSIQTLQTLFPNSTITQIQTIEKGYEHFISILTFSDSTKFVFRSCRQPSDKFHFAFLHFLSQLLLSKQVPVASILKFSNDFCVETYLQGTDISDLPDNWNSLHKNQFDQFCSQLATHMRHMHSIPCKKYGNLDKQQSLVQNYCIGSDEHWIDTFIPSFSNFLISIPTIAKPFVSSLEKIVLHVTPFLLSFSSPVLLHCDLNANNIRVQMKNSEPYLLTISGIVDFGDVKSGDYRFDLGRLLCHWKGDWQKMKLLCQYYYNNTQLSKYDVTMIQFYAIYYTVFLLCVMNQDEKYFFILNKLIPLFYSSCLSNEN